MAGLKLDMNKVRQLIDEGYISVNQHESFPIYIYNYTTKCQIDWHWTPETLVCRGLILDDNDDVVARPFPKFFTPNQYRDLRCKVHYLFGLQYKELYQGGFVVTEKIDGSMGVLYTHNGQHYISTRGSFTSEQAIHGTKVLHDKYNNFDFVEGYTYIFEIVYPENRIVVDYCGVDDLFLLAVLDNNTGKDEPSLKQKWIDAGYPYAKDVQFTNFDDILSYQGDGEGFVVKFHNGLRVKIKFEEYLRLHKILTGISARDIWWRLRQQESLDDILQVVPDEFYNWVKRVERELNSQYTKITQHVLSVIEEDIVKRNPPLTRKQLAIKYQSYAYRDIMFRMLDNKQYQESIWRLIKPKADKPFQQEEEQNG